MDATSPTPTKPRLMQRLFTIGQRLLPWASLVGGIAGALMMDRGPGRAMLVAGSAIGAWLLMLLTLLLRRRHIDRENEPHKVWLGVWFSTLTATQGAIQLSLFFALPFYWRAWAGTVPQLFFLIALSLVSVASLWDPLTERLLHRPGAAPVLPAFASFAGLNAVLPGLGLSNSQSLWVAAGCTAAAMPIGLVGARLRGSARVRLWLTTMAGAAAIPFLLMIGGAALIPAAPLALLDIAIGDHQRSRWVEEELSELAREPGMLMCATSIWAPLGVKEQLYHVWRQDGVIRDRIELEISGGRDDGYRTWSRKRNFGDDPSGKWTCSVETRMGQSLGSEKIEINP